MNCSVLPAVMEGLAGAIAIDTSVTAGGVVPPEPELPPQPTNRLTPSKRIDSSNRFIRNSLGLYAREMLILDATTVTRSILVSKRKGIEEK